MDSERVSGLAKVIRGLVVPALENVPLWHERDLTDSSSERFIIPLTFIVLDEMLLTLVNVLKNLRIFPENMQRNLEVTKGAILTEAVMMALARKGMGRQRAHEVLRGISVRVFNEGIPLRDLLYKTPEVTAYLSRKEIDELTEPNKYLGRVRQLIDRAVRYAKSV